MSETLPKVTEIARWNPQRGDRLIVNVDGGYITEESAAEIKRRVIDTLQVPHWVPVVMVTPPVSLTVVGMSDDPDDPRG